MLLQVGTAATQKTRALFLGQSNHPGIAAVLQQTSEATNTMVGLTGSHIVAENVAPEIADRAMGAHYPTIHIYCTKLVNSLKEKFRTFSGEAQMTAEIRVSQDRLQQLESSTQMLAGAVAGVLDCSRGDWGDGVFYAGGYEVNFAPVKQGGRNFIQIAKVSFILQLSN